MVLSTLLFLNHQQPKEYHQQQITSYHYPPHLLVAQISQSHHSMFHGYETLPAPMEGILQSWWCERWTVGHMYQHQVLLGWASMTEP